MADVTVTAAEVLPKTGVNATQTSEVTWGGTITAGLAVYRDTADNNDCKAADCLAAASAVVAGIAMNGGGDGQPGQIAVSGNIDPGFTVAVGETYVLSEAGAITPITDLATDDYVAIIGHGIDATTLRLNIQNLGVQVP